MEMKEKIKKSFFRKRPLLAACSILFLIIVILVFIGINQEPKPDPASERTIRKAAAKQLGKDPNELTDGDFTKILEFSFYEKGEKYQSGFTYIPPWASTELSDIRLLKKFTNLELLDLFSIKYPETRIPKWMKYLSKYGIISLNKKFAIDLSPIQNLHTLKMLRLNHAQICDIKPLKKLTNLEILYIQNCDITDKQVEELQKALPNLKIIR